MKPPTTNRVELSREWGLAEAVYKGLHQWPLLLVLCLLGAVLGWAASFLWPHTFRTRAQIYVGLNPYRAYSDSNFIALAYPQYSNVDDYKNWQMSQLSSVIFSEDVLNQTLEILREEDAYWSEVDTGRLHDMLRAEWRTAGTWTLLADSRNAKRSNQAVRAWSREVVRVMREAVFAAEQVIQLDETRRSLTDEQIQADLKQQEYQASAAMLNEWLKQAGELPQDQPLDPVERWRILYLAGRAAQYSVGWAGILKEQPEEEALPAAYAEWIERVLTAIKSETPALQQRSEYLAEQLRLLQRDYEKQMATSLGISPNLVVKGLDKSLPEVLRPTALMAAIGAFSGLLIWVIWVIAGITREKLRA